MDFVIKNVDRLLSRLVPAVSAAACRPPDPFYFCGAGGYRLYCHNNCAGILTCVFVGSC
jgi:hypothetical protein